jgi:RNA polymerase sigma-70 factor (ECF subfamily)
MAVEVNGLEFSQHLLRHDRTLLRYIMTFIPRRDDAEEVLQRVATALWEKYPGYDRTCEFLPWALRFAYIEVLNFRKEQARNRLVFNAEILDLLKETRDQLDPILERQLTALQVCLQKIDQAGLALLRRRYCDSEKACSIAEESGQTLKALYRKLDRIREKVARCIEQRLSEEML